MKREESLEVFVEVQGILGEVEGDGGSPAHAGRSLMIPAGQP